MNEQPTVFISYSHDNDEHEKWVKKLYNDLLSRNVKVFFDQVDLRLGSDIRFFIENGLKSSSIILCIFSESYVDKVEKGFGGAGYEGMIITAPLLKNANTDNIIPILRNNPDKKIPLAFQTKLYIDFSSDVKYLENFSKLLDRITGADLVINKMDNNPSSSLLAQKILKKTDNETIRYSSYEMNGSVDFYFDNNNGYYSLGTGKYTFKTRWSRAGNNSIHAYGNIGYNFEICDFPAYSDISQFDFSSKVRMIKTGHLVIFQNDYGCFVAIKIGEVKSSGHGFPRDEMHFEYKIYNGPDLL